MSGMPEMDAYVPGKTARPPEDYFRAIRDTAQPGMSVEDLRNSRAWQFGWQLFENSYYWEAHEVWEPVWLNLPPNSAERQIVRACIQFTNACLKQEMGRPKAAKRLCNEVLELLSSTEEQESDFGVDIANLILKVLTLKAAAQEDEL